MSGHGDGETGWKWPRLKHVEEITPFLAIVALVSLPWVLRLDVVISEASMIRMKRIVQAFDEAPWTVNGRWAGEAVPVPATATRILRPTAILSRRYRAVETWDEEDDLNGVEATLVIVHCSEMRDMQGHYPPVCYPAYGWMMRADGTEQLTFNSRTLGECEVTRYEFQRGGALEKKRGLRILNLFLMPDGDVSPDIEALNAMKRWRSTSMLGVAQVQLVVDDAIDDERSLRILGELVDGMPNLFDRLLKSQ